MIPRADSNHLIRSMESLQTRFASSAPAEQPHAAAPVVEEPHWRENSIAGVQNLPRSAPEANAV
jgi:hypothetical protein